MESYYTIPISYIKDTCKWLCTDPGNVLYVCGNPNYAASALKEVIHSAHLIIRDVQVVVCKDATLRSNKPATVIFLAADGKEVSKDILLRAITSTVGATYNGVEISHLVDIGLFLEKNPKHHMMVEGPSDCGKNQLVTSMDTAFKVRREQIYVTESSLNRGSQIRTVVSLTSPEKIVSGYDQDLTKMLIDGKNAK